MNILHLSDIHFGRERSGIQESFSQHKEILDKLIQTLSTLSDGLKPDLVLVTGDIAWRGKPSEFMDAVDWFQRLRDALNLAPDRLVFCPGNHDLNRDTAIHFQEEELQKENENGKKVLDIQKCDELYEYRNAHKLETRFHNYNLFCKTMGMQPYSYRDEEGVIQYSYLIGSSRFRFGKEAFQISCFNTAYLPYGKVLRDDQMFLGLPQIQSMINEGTLPEAADTTYRIALFHHADRYLHPNEQCEYDGRIASLPLLMEHVDLALCGHTETGGVPLLRTFGNGGCLLSGGAAYYNDDHPNSFSLIRVHKGQAPQICPFFYNGSDWVRFLTCPEPNWLPENAQMQWHHPYNALPQFTFAVLIDDKRFEVYSGPFETGFVGVAEDKGVFLFDNRVDPARLTNVFLKLEPPDGHETCLGICNAPAVFQTMASRSIHTRYHDFIKDNISGATTACHVLLDSNNKVIWNNPMDIDRTTNLYAKHCSRADWYSLVQRLEDRFEVTFLHPNTDVPSEFEQQAINWLAEIMDEGDLHLGLAGEALFWYYAHSEKEMGIASQAFVHNIPLALQFTRRIKFCLFGVEIKLGECDFYLVGGKAKDFYDITHKLRSWRPNDRRVVELIFPEGSDLWLVPHHLPVQENANSASAGSVKQNPTKDAFTLRLPPQAEIPWSDSMKPFFKEY